MKKPEKTQQEIDEHEAAKTLRRAYRSSCTKAKRSMIELCRNRGLSTGQAQLDYALSHKYVIIPLEHMNKDEMLEAWAKGIEEYKSELILNREA